MASGYRRALRAKKPSPRCRSSGHRSTRHDFGTTVSQYENDLLILPARTATDPTGTAAPSPTP